MTRTTYTSANVGTVSPSDFLDQYSARLKVLFDASALPLSSVAGTNDLTATLDPALDGDGLVSGMVVSFVAPATNTDVMTLAINGGSQIDILDAAGLQLPVGAVSSGLLVQAQYDGSDFRMISPTGIDSGVLFGAYIFTTSGTFTKPDGLDDNRLVILGAWGGGAGGGASSGGGGGGAYVDRIVRGSDLSSSVTVTVSTSAGVGVDGGNTTIGALLTAYGGATIGTGGGRQQSGAAGGLLGGGTPGLPGPDPAATDGGIGENGGGGGGGGGSGTNGGWSERGGGGGGSVSGTGGTSLGPYGPLGAGGAGGDDGVAGQPRGGGGGRNAAGGRGEAFIILL